ncbi:hypothetical protein [Streptomyces sp. NPDC001889]
MITPPLRLSVRLQIGDTPPCEAGWIELGGEPPTGTVIADFLRGVADVYEQVDQEEVPGAAADG